MDTGQANSLDEDGEDPQPAVDVRLLGAFEAFDATGARLAITSRRSRALLACLAVDDGGDWTRTRLATLLWNRTEQQGRSSLRQELVQLRKALGITAPGDWGDEVHVRLPPQVQTDVALFRAAVSGNDAERAAAIWRGELLAGSTANAEPFTDWLALARSALRQQAIDCFAHALHALQDDQDPLRLEQIALQLTSLDPANEDAHRCLMRCAAARHDVAGVLDQYRDYVAVLGQAGNAEPSPAMKRLLNETIADSRNQIRAASRDAPGWITEINRQHLAAAPPQPTRPLPVEAVASLAVLPFADISSGPVRAAWADGLTEETTNALARIPGAFVTARQSCMVYKGSTADVRTIAAELGVRYLVEGSLERIGRSVRVNARLINGQTGLHVWANGYEEELGEFFSIRNRIVRAVAGQLQPALMTAEIERALEAGPADLGAWTRLQRAHAHVLFNRSPRGLSGAVTELTKALAIDPDYAMARALLSAVHTWRAMWSSDSRMLRERALALDHADRARRTAPDNAFVLTNCADTAIYSGGDLDLALELLNAAVRQNPFDPQALALLANANRVAGGDPAESLRQIAEARRISPRDPRSHRWLHYAGWCHWKLGDLDKMEESARAAIELYSDSPAQWIELTCALGLQGRRAEAREAGKVLKKLSPAFSADGFFELARRFYGKRFTAQVEMEYRALCSELNRAT